MATWQVGTYRLYQYAGTTEVKAVIIMEEHKGTNRIYAWFTMQIPLPPNSINGPFLLTYFPYDMFVPVMEMLREEKPVWVHANATAVVIATDREPIGEDEGP